MHNDIFFVTGISTEVGKTVASAVITEALEADYWKPVQAGELELTDAMRVKGLVSNSRSVFHPGAYELEHPMSPHAAAALQGVELDINGISLPQTRNRLVIEGAGGLMVPLNNTHTIADLIQPHYKVIVVSRHYLGSINHTLLSLFYLKQKGLTPYVLFNGKENRATEDIIKRMSGVPVLGRLEETESVDKEFVRAFAERLRPALEKL